MPARWLPCGKGSNVVKPPPLPKLPPPLPPRPKRRSSFPAAEPATPAKGQTLATYQGLLSVFDEIPQTTRPEFIELAFVFKSLSPKSAKLLLELATHLTNVSG